MMLALVLAQHVNGNSEKTNQLQHFTAFNSAFML